MIVKEQLRMSDLVMRETRKGVIVESVASTSDLKVCFTHSGDDSSIPFTYRELGSNRSRKHPDMEVVYDYLFARSNW